MKLSSSFLDAALGGIRPANLLVVPAVDHKGRVRSILMAANKGASGSSMSRTAVDFDEWDVRLSKFLAAQMAVVIANSEEGQAQRLVFGSIADIMQKSRGQFAPAH